MTVNTCAQQNYKSGSDLTEANRIISAVDRAAKDLAAVDEQAGIDRAPGRGKVSVKNYIQDSQTGRTYSGKYSYNAVSGAKENLDIYMKGDVYNDPDWMGVNYSFAKGGKNDVYTRVDRQDFYVSYIEEARVNTVTGEIKYHAYKQDTTPPPNPPVPPYPPYPPYPH